MRIINPYNICVNGSKQSFGKEGTTMSKGYTISYFVKVLKNAKVSSFTKTSVYNIVSPRDGALSVKAGALDTWLGHQTSSISLGTGRFASYGKTSRARLLFALKNRKMTGSI